MQVKVLEDIPLRITGTGTFIEAGIYEVVREFEEDRYIIKVNKFNADSNIITLVDKIECEVIA